MQNKKHFKQLLLLPLIFTFPDSITFGQNCSDINTDGSTNIVDALLIAQLYVGLISTLDCCGETPTPTPQPAYETVFAVNCEGRNSKASNAIIAALDKDDPRPIYIGFWGGPREVAQAIWKVQDTRSQAELDAFISKLRLFLIHCQDATNQWLMDNFPDLFIVWSRYTYQGMFGVDNLAWTTENIVNNHGPLCAIYPDYDYQGTSAGVVGGDSPLFLWLVSANMHPLGRNLMGNNPDDPTQPSWGGRYNHRSGTNHYVDGPGGSTISQYASDFQAEFAEHADWWCVQ